MPSSCFYVLILVFMSVCIHIRGDTAKSCGIEGNEQDGYSYDCNGRGFSSIPNDFHKNTVNITLDDNSIPDILAHSLSMYQNLLSLSLQRNKISTINETAFSSNSKLFGLDISQNHLKEIKTGTFSFLKQLKRLAIFQNNIGNFIKLTREICLNNKELEYLAVDVYDGFSFHYECCRNMSLLRTLILKTRNKTSFRNESLQCFEKTKIRELGILAGDGVSRPLGANFLGPLHFVKTIRIEGFGMPTSYVLNRLLYPLQNGSLDSLILRSVHFVKIETLSEEALEYLPSICIKNLSLHSCQIQDIKFSRIRSSKLWSCLEKFEVQNNFMLSFGRFLLFSLTLPKIIHIDVCCQQVRQGISTDTFDPPPRVSPDSKIQKKRHGMTEVFLPKSIRYLSFSDNDLRSNAYDEDFYIHGELEKGEFNNLHFKSCLGRIKGLKNLKILEIRQWNCQRMNPEFIAHLSSIRDLSFTKCNIGLNTKPLPIISNLTNLSYLNLAENSIDDLHSSFFKSQIRILVNVSLAVNNFKNIPKAMLVLRKLQYLDLRHNLISGLSAEERDFIDGLEHLKISLGGNDLQCSCDSLPFLYWVQRNSYKFQDYESLTCVYNKDPGVKLSSVIEHLHEVEIECVSHIWLGISISALICIILLIILAFMFYKFQPDVRYVLARIKRILRNRTDSGTLSLNGMQYHAFVSYGDVNYQWAYHTLWKTLDKEGFRLILKDLHFDAGKDESTNILDAIDCSRRVIFVLTHDFLENEWNEYHIQIARLHAFRNETTNFIIVIQVDDIPPHAIPKSLQRIWIRVKCLRWPKGGDRNSILSFWKELRNELTMD